MNPMALWCISPSSAELRAGELGHGVLVETLFSGISRGTERLVFEGRVPESETTSMRAPSQEGDFPFPVKFGYCAVGRVMEGELAGKEVFALHPHQTQFRLPEQLLHPLPKNLPAETAILAANMETALNIVWDSGVSAGDRVAVIGAGVVGSLVGYLVKQIPGTEVTLVDINPERERVAIKFGCSFAEPAKAPLGCDVVIHTSATEEGIALAIESAAQEARVVEASWYGDKAIQMSLGGKFHSKRLRLISSQVGNLPPDRANRWSHQRRIRKALELLENPVVDVLISGETDFSDIANSYESVLNDNNTLCHRIRYQDLGEA